MKIAYTFDQLLKCGGVRVPFEHAQELARRKHEVAIYANRQENAIDDWKNRYNVQIRPLEALSEGVDVLINCWWALMDENLLDYPTKKRYHFVQGRDYLSYPDGSFKERNLKAMQRDDWDYLAVSKWAGESCRDPQIVPNGVDCRFFTPNKFTKLFNKKRILFESSSPDKGKGRLQAIEILKKIKQEFPNEVELWEVTKYAQDQSIFDVQHVDPNDVTILNSYQNCDILLKTSKFDGFGLSHLEAMACQCAVVTTNAGGNAEFCKDDVNCFMSNDELDLVNGIKRLILDKQKYDEIVREGLFTAQSMTWSRSIDILLKVINK